MVGFLAGFALGCGLGGAGEAGGTLRMSFIAGMGGGRRGGGSRPSSPFRWDVVPLVICGAGIVGFIHLPLLILMLFLLLLITIASSTVLLFVPVLVVLGGVGGKFTFAFGEGGALAGFELADAAGEFRFLYQSRLDFLNC